MKKLPESDDALLLRTDFSDDTAWNALSEAVQAEGWMGFRAYLNCISDPVHDGLTAERIVALPAGRGNHTFLFLADRWSMIDLEQSVEVVDLDDEPGRTFRVIPWELGSVENNLSISNCEFADFADHVHKDGVFRGYPEQ